PCPSKYEFRVLARLLVDRRSNPADPDSSRFPPPYPARRLLQKRAASLRLSRFDNCKCGRVDGPGFGCLDCEALRDNAAFDLQFSAERNGMNLEPDPKVIATSATCLPHLAGLGSFRLSEGPLVSRQLLLASC